MPKPPHLFASLFVDHPTGSVAEQGVVHIVGDVDAPRTLCGREAHSAESAPGYASCRSCIKAIGVTPPDPITLDEFTALARELGVDMDDISWATTADLLDEDGMPYVHYPANTYETLLAALARVV